MVAMANNSSDQVFALLLVIVCQGTATIAAESLQTDESESLKIEIFFFCIYVVSL